MHELTVINSTTKTMTSLEISELVESRHDKVKQSIERLAKRGVIALPPMGENPTGELGGRPGTFYLLDKRSSLVVVAQLSPEFTARVVDRWQELEAQAATQAFQLPDFTNPIIAARAWADEVEQKVELEKQLKIQAPKVGAFDRIANASGTYNLTTTAKILNVQPSAFTDYLAANKYIYKRAGAKSWVGYQLRVEQGILTHRSFLYVDREGRDQTGEQVLCTAKGLTHFAEIFIGKPQQKVAGIRGGKSVAKAN